MVGIRPVSYPKAVRSATRVCWTASRTFRSLSAGCACSTSRASSAAPAVHTLSTVGSAGSRSSGYSVISSSAGFAVGSRCARGSGWAGSSVTTTHITSGIQDRKQSHAEYQSFHFFVSPVLEAGNPATNAPVDGIFGRSWETGASRAGARLGAGPIWDEGKGAMSRLGCANPGSRRGRGDAMETTGADFQSTSGYLSLTLRGRFYGNHRWSCDHMSLAIGCGVSITDNAQRAGQQHWTG